jgi:hypothetical protein
MSGNAYLSQPVVYWLDTINGTVKMGLPEQFPAPPFHEKIVCNTVWDVDRWSQKMREQERIRQQMDDDKRGAEEERIRGEIRAHIHRQMANSRNNLNRDFLRLYLERSSQLPNDPTRWNRESYLHIEGYEKDK